MSRHPDGVVFDCDGTIADTESLADLAWTEALADRGYEVTREDLAAVIGHPFGQNWEYFSARASLGEHDAFRSRLRERFTELLDGQLRFHTDVVGVIRELGAAGVPLAVASSSSHAHVRRVLERGGIQTFVRAVVGADDVTEHKPSPRPYLVAARHLGVPPDRCSAVEDTPVGVASATAAGLFTVAVVRDHGDPVALAAADRVVSELRTSDLVPGTQGRAADRQRAVGGGGAWAGG